MRGAHRVRRQRPTTTPQIANIPPAGLEERPVGRPPFHNFVEGTWQPSAAGKTYETRNPWTPSEVIGSFVDSQAADADRAAAAAVIAFREWSSLSTARRAAFLRDAADAAESRVEQIAVDMTLETGKPLREARSEANRVAEILRYSASDAWRPHGELFQQAATGGAIYTVKRPVGVVALITPWNFPAAIPVWKLAPALISGNTVVLKPSELAPLTALHIAAAFQQAGLPPGVLNVVTGFGPSAGTALIRNPSVAAVSFTGSAAVGHAIRDEATRLGKRVQLELGGHNPLLVLADADLESAVEAAYVGAFWSAGQKCMSTRRIFIHASVYDNFKQRFLERVQRSVVGDPLDPQTEIGPLVSDRHVKRLEDALETVKAEGGTVLVGGVRLANTGHLFAPTIVEGLSDDASLSREEVFGPLVALYSFGELEDAIERANSVKYGLSAAIFTRDVRSIRMFVDRLQAGVLRINSQTVGTECHVPFGGLKESGFGPPEQGQAARTFYTDVVTVYDGI